jgi:hypothetical protein
MFTRHLRPLALVFALGAGLAACSGVNPPMKRLPEMTFRNLPPIQLDVGRIEVVSQFSPPAQSPHIEYDMPVAPENAIKRWVQDRLQPIGRSGTLRVVIRDASATERPLKTDQTWTGVFKKEQAARVEMGVDVAVQMLDDHQFVTAEASNRVAVSRTTPEGLKLNEHDKILYDMVEELMRDFNNGIDPGIHSSLARWIQ